jgi:hypothetical protein
LHRICNDSDPLQHRAADIVNRKLPAANVPLSPCKEGKMRTVSLFFVILVCILNLSGCGSKPLQAAANTVVSDAGTDMDLASEAEPLPEEIRAAQAHYRALFDEAFMERTVFYKYDEILVQWPEQMRSFGDITLRIQSPDGRIYAEGHKHVAGGSTINLGKAYLLRDGHYHVVLMPPVLEYYIDDVRVKRKIDIEIRAWQDQ